MPDLQAEVARQLRSDIRKAHDQGLEISEIQEIVEETLDVLESEDNA